MLGAVTVQARIPPRIAGDYDENPTVTIWELAEADPQGRPQVVTTASVNTHQDITSNGGPETVSPTLQVDTDSLVVLDIHRMKPIYTEMSTDRERLNKSDLFWLTHDPRQDTDGPPK